MQHFSDQLSGPKPDEAGWLDGGRGSSMRVALRETKTKRERQTDRQAVRQRQAEREKETGTEKDGDRQRQTVR